MVARGKENICVGPKGKGKVSNILILVWITVWSWNQELEFQGYHDKMKIGFRQCGDCRAVVHNIHIVNFDNNFRIWMVYSINEKLAFFATVSSISKVEIE